MSKNEITLTPLEKEIALIFNGFSFINLYLHEIQEKDEDMSIYEKPIRLLKKLRYIVKIYGKKAISMHDDIVEILEEVEAESKKIKPLKKFEKRVRFDGNDLGVNGLLFGVALLLEHRNLKKRVLRLDYDLCNDIYLSFEGKHSKSIDNARVLSKKIGDKFTNE